MKKIFLILVVVLLAACSNESEINYPESVKNGTVSKDFYEETLLLKEYITSYQSEIRDVLQSDRENEIKAEYIIKTSNRYKKQIDNLSFEFSGDDNSGEHEFYIKLAYEELLYAVNHYSERSSNNWVERDFEVANDVLTALGTSFMRVTMGIGLLDK